MRLPLLGLTLALACDVAAPTGDTQSGAESFGPNEVEIPAEEPATNRPARNDFIQEVPPDPLSTEHLLALADEAADSYGAAGRAYSEAATSYRAANVEAHAATFLYEMSEEDWKAAESAWRVAKIVVYAAAAWDIANDLGRGATKSDFKNLKGERGIYEFRGRSGLPYCGKSVNVARRLMEHVASGKLPAGATVRFTPVTGGAQALAKAEQACIDGHGGLAATENLVNAITR